MLVQHTRWLKCHGLTITLRRFSGSLHVSLEPLQDENDGIFALSLTRPEARNALGVLLAMFFPYCSSYSNMLLEHSASLSMLLCSLPTALALGLYWQRSLSASYVWQAYHWKSVQEQQTLQLPVSKAVQGNLLPKPGRQMLRELGEALRMLCHERSTRCVVVRSSSPGMFCAGADLKVKRQAVDSLLALSTIWYCAASTGAFLVQDRGIPVV